MPSLFPTLCQPAPTGRSSSVRATFSAQVSAVALLLKVLFSWSTVVVPFVILSRVRNEKRQFFNVLFSILIVAKPVPFYNRVIRNSNTTILYPFVILRLQSMHSTCRNKHLNARIYNTEKP